MILVSFGVCIYTVCEPRVLDVNLSGNPWCYFGVCGFKATIRENEVRATIKAAFGIGNHRGAARCRLTPIKIRQNDLRWQSLATVYIHIYIRQMYRFFSILMKKYDFALIIVGFVVLARVYIYIYGF